MSAVSGLPFRSLVHWTSLTDATSDESAASVHVITAILDTDVKDWAHWMGRFVLEARNMDSSKYILKVHSRVLHRNLGRGQINFPANI